MRNTGKRNGGFTLIELLIVIAIIGILAAVLIPNLMQARRSATDRAAQAYTQNVYKAAYAFLADTNTSPKGGTCGSGTVYTEGSYSVPDPGNVVKTCTVTVAANGDPSVAVTSSNGTAYSAP